MTTKNKLNPEPPNEKRILTVRRSKDDDPREALSRALLEPEVTAAFNMQLWEPQHPSVDGLRAALTEQVDEVSRGNMKRPEAMLLSQAHTLDALFNNLAQKAHGQTHLPHYESFLRLALKAQGQCRSTLETLAAIKNPPVIFAKQTNINNGNQQINNGSPVHAGEITNQKSELLEHTHGERLDTRTKGEAIGINSDLEAVE